MDMLQIWRAELSKPNVDLFRGPLLQEKNPVININDTL